MRFIARQSLSRIRMASTKPPGKLIFAPGANSTSGQAEQYLKGSLESSDLHADPFAQFKAWFDHARSQNVYQPETVCLSTASLPSGAPSSRFVYLKEFDTHGFVIYSNWATSRKSADLQSNPQASLAFWWHEIERQVRIEGSTQRLTKEESQEYFSLRARGSKIGAWASEQTSILKEEDGGRKRLDHRVQQIEERFEGVPDSAIEVPEFWGGLRIIPKAFEFWQGRDSRLHDRFRYTKDVEELGKGVTQWKIERLSP